MCYETRSWFYYDGTRRRILRNSKAKNRRSNNGKGGRRIIGNLIKSIAIITALLIFSIIASAYVWYFVGMSISLAAGAILGLAGGTIAQIFAWIGVGAVVYWFAVFIGKVVDTSFGKTNISKDELSEEEIEIGRAHV